MKLPALKIGDLKAKLPIIQGGMGIGISLSKLAGTVASLGGVGVISGVQIGFREEDFYDEPLKANLRALKDEIHKARNMAPEGILGVNLMVAMNNYDELVICAAENNADLIISGAGLPIHLPKLLKGYKSKAVPIVSSKRAAEVILKHWYKKYEYIPPLIIVEGPEAGGHLGFSKEELTDGKHELKDLVLGVIETAKKYEKIKGEKVSVAAAGGIFTGEDIVRFLNLGADAVQMATRFVATEECDAPISFKNAYVNASKEDIVIVKSPVGMPGRAIKNNFLERAFQGKDKEYLKLKKCIGCLKGCKPEEIPYCISKALLNSVNSNVEDGLIFTGSSSYKIKDIVKTEDLIKELILDAERV